MNDLEPIRQRLMREEPRKRLGHLAADLLRIANFIESGSADERKKGAWHLFFQNPVSDILLETVLK